MMCTRRFGASWRLRGIGALLSFAVAGTVAAQGLADRAAWPRTDFSHRSVELSEILSGGPPKDGIPAIDHPRFVTVAQARKWLKSAEPVIVLRLRGVARAYPIQILMFHEIVNDVVGGMPVAVTFCPLCNAAIAFDRTVDGRVLDFGTTGKLRNSDLVMYDRQTESWWQQFTGRGIVGHYAGKALEALPSAMVSFEDFASASPRGQVLSRETGFVRPYGRNPYAGYDRADQSPFLFTGKPDGRLPPMERVLAITGRGRDRIYPLTLLEKHPVTEQELDGVPYAVFAKAGMSSPLDRAEIELGREIPAAVAYDRRLDGRVLQFAARDGRIVDRTTGSEWNILGEAVAGPLTGKRLVQLPGGVHFAFAWLAFNPESEIVRTLP